jgi:hypothetical protein
MRPAAEVAAGALASPRITKADVDGYFAADAPGLGGTVKEVLASTMHPTCRSPAAAAPNDPRHAAPKAAKRLRVSGRCLRLG